MDYIEVFQNLRTNNKYGRKSPHKAVLMLAVIEMFEQNVLSDNEIYYDDTLKSMFLKVWNRVFPEEPLFNPEAYFPFWYLQSDSFWHIVPIRGHEEILSMMRDTNVKPSERKLMEHVRYAELDEDLYFLMTLPSGRSSLKRTLLETYSNLSEKQIEILSKSEDNTIDNSISAISEYNDFLLKSKEDKTDEILKVDDELVAQFNRLSEDVQIEFNLQYFSFLKEHREEREMFKEICPTVYGLYDKIVNNPIKRGEISPLLTFIFENFLSDLKISILSEEGAIEMIDKIDEALNLLRGKQDEKEEVEQRLEPEPIEVKVVEKESSPSVVFSEHDISIESRRGKSWTDEEEKQIKKYFLQGKSFQTIADIVGRTKVAVMSRLGKIGVIDYTYGHDENSKICEVQQKEVTNASDFRIKNLLERSLILNSNGEKVFVTDGKLKFLNGKLYRLNLKPECFTLKAMLFNGDVWMKGGKKIVAYPSTKLYRTLINVDDYSEDINDIRDSTIFDECRLKVGEVWYDYRGDPIEDVKQYEAVEIDSTPSYNDIPLYHERKDAILRAMRLFRLPVRIKDICRTISRSAWGDTIREPDVVKIIKTMPEISLVDEKYELKR